MPRPVPYSAFQIGIARRVQKTQKKVLSSPTLLEGNPSRSFVLITGADDKKLHAFDLELGRITHHLPLPDAARKATDFTKFVYSSSHELICAYNRSEHLFALWSLVDSRLVKTIQGEGLIPPSMVFFNEDQKVALCDSHKVIILNSEGTQLDEILFSENIESALLYSVPSGAGDFILTGMFLDDEKTKRLSCYQVEDGKVKKSGDGPSRSPLEATALKEITNLYDFNRIPGHTKQYLVFLEEETLTVSDVFDKTAPEDTYRTHLLALNPTECKFYDDHLQLPGRFCLEIRENELLLVNEKGMYRRIEGYPLKLIKADWRLEGNSK